ncbi:MAG TPA: DUF4040 domain-containing protein [Bacillota bacterium]|nr:DUF4040 domain-containing protein [Bacillota bacterium]
MDEAIRIFLLVMLIACAVSVSFTKKLLSAVVIFTSYSLIMAIVWVLLESPDLAVTEAAVGAGITGVLFFLTLKKINMIDSDTKENDEDEKK